MLPQLLKDTLYDDLIIYGLFNDAVRSSGYIALNGRMMNEQYILRMWDEVIIALLSSHFHGQTEEIHPETSS
jgi:hypothetical protein